MKTRPSGEKRRKEMLRLERSKDKAEKRKARKEERNNPRPPGDSSADAVAAPEGGAEVSGGAVPSSDAG
jgi:hypothetical protein